VNGAELIGGFEGDLFRVVQPVRVLQPELFNEDDDGHPTGEDFERAGFGFAASGKGNPWMPNRLGATEWDEVLEVVQRARPTPAGAVDLDLERWSAGRMVRSGQFATPVEKTPAARRPLFVSGVTLDVFEWHPQDFIPGPIDGVPVKRLCGAEARDCGKGVASENRRDCQGDAGC